jgi:P-type E1-E2 ATPase
MIFARQHTTEWALRAIRRASWRAALIVFVAVEGRSIGALLLADELRSDTPRAIRMLRTAGVARIVMVTGDRAAAAQAIGAALDLDAVLANRVPSDKVDAVRAERRLHPTIMVGDGINDAPTLASADVGIALGARGASASSVRATFTVARLSVAAAGMARVGTKARVVMQSMKRPFNPHLLWLTPSSNTMRLTESRQFGLDLN